MTDGAKRTCLLSMKPTHGCSIKPGVAAAQAALAFRFQMLLVTCNVPGLMGTDEFAGTVMPFGEDAGPASGQVNVAAPA